MLFKTSTILTSTLPAILHHQKGQRQAIFVAAVLASALLWKICCVPGRQSEATAAVPVETSTNDQKMAGMKWSYDEMAHKLIVENTDLAYVEIGDGFTKGVGRALNKVTRQGVARNNAGKRVLVNL